VEEQNAELKKESLTQALAEVEKFYYILKTSVGLSILRRDELGNEYLQAEAMEKLRKRFSGVAVFAFNSLLK
jgi:hypothetical protein